MASGVLGQEFKQAAFLGRGMDGWKWQVGFGMGIGQAIDDNGKAKKGRAECL